MKRLPLFLLLLPVLAQAAGRRTPIRTTPFSILCPPGWEARKTRAGLLADLIRFYPGKREHAARIQIRSYPQQGRRLPDFARSLVNSIRIQHFTTTERQIVKGPPVFHYNYLFEHEPSGNPGDRFLWINMRIIPDNGRYLVYTAAARSRTELEATVLVFRSLKREK